MTPNDLGALPLRDDLEVVLALEGRKVACRHRDHVGRPPGNQGKWAHPLGNWVRPLGDWAHPLGNWVRPLGDWAHPLGNWVRPLGDWAAERAAAGPPPP